VGAVSAYAQQATITGTVTDSSGGVLPGVTINIVHDETGNTFEAVTDTRVNSASRCVLARTG
jgi:hypothetical protein